MNKDLQPSLQRQLYHPPRSRRRSADDRDESVGVFAHFRIADRASAAAVFRLVGREAFRRDIVFLRPPLAEGINASRTAGDDFGDLVPRVRDGGADDVEVVEIASASDDRFHGRFVPMRVGLNFLVSAITS